MTEQLLTQSLAIILAYAVAIGFFAASRMPAAMGYLLAVLAIGPYGMNLVSMSDDTRFLAELGLIFLMFMVGLEFSLNNLLAARNDVLLAGSLQVGARLTVIATGLWWLGLEPRLAILLGGAVAMSSTAVVVKQLAEQARSRASTAVSRHPVVPGYRDHSVSRCSGQLVTAAGLRPACSPATSRAGSDHARRCRPHRPPLVRMVLANAAKSRSSDLFLLTALLAALGAAYIAHLAGLALPVGAFSAGMAISGSDFRPRRGRLAPVSRHPCRPVLHYGGHGDRSLTDRRFSRHDPGLLPGRSPREVIFFDGVILRLRCASRQTSPTGANSACCS